ncbi:hypothetical protein D3C80_1303210 [compost metagenome]
MAAIVLVIEPGKSNQFSNSKELTPIDGFRLKVGYIVAFANPVLALADITAYSLDFTSGLRLKSEAGIPPAKSTETSAASMFPALSILSGYSPHKICKAFS